MIDWVNVNNMMYEAMHERCDIIIFYLYLMCLAWDDNYSKITCEMLIIKGFQGKYLVIVWLMYALI